MELYVNLTIGLQLQRSQYGGRHCVTMLSGDGVGPEMMRHVKEVFR